jgi:hypothetical protein
MNSNHDPEAQALRELFAQQRSEEHAAAPPWMARLPQPPTMRSRSHPVWFWPAIGATACLLLTFALRQRPVARQDLTSLPPLLPLPIASSAPLLKDTSLDLALTDAASPTDFLLPTHLTIQIL